MFANEILSLLIWLPILGGALVLATGNDKHAEATRWVALVFGIFTMLLAILAYINFNPALWQMQFVEDVAWIPALHVRYSLGIDGISLLFILLTCFTNLIIILAAWHGVKTKIAQYMAVFLVSTGIMNGAFAATDSILFYFFWEASLIPMYLGIGVWGGKLRAYASLKFFLYTFLGSVFMLMALLYMGAKTGNFSISSFTQLPLTINEQDLIFLAFLAAFAVKIPMWPVHTWLPDAHTEAPAGGSVVLAALMLKMGAYGFIRFSLPIVPNIHREFEWLLIALSLIAVIYVGFACLAQKDMKRLIAYSSVSHMGIVTLGLFMVFTIVGQTHDQVDAMMSIQGAMFQMIAHAFSSGALFVGVSYLYLRFGSRMISDYQGITHSMPVFAAFYMLFAMANVGLPGTSGFVGEFLVILAAFKANIWIATAAAVTVILAPAYTLWMYKRVLFGTYKTPEMKKGRDVHGMELTVFILLAVPIIVFGVYPDALLHVSQATTQHFVEVIMQKIPTGGY